MGGGDNKSADLLQHLSVQREMLMRPQLTEALGMLQSLFTTGGTQPRQGVVQSAMDRSMRAGTQAREKTSEDLARTGIAGTPFGQDIMSQFDLTQYLELADLITQLRESDYWGHLQLLIPLLTQVMATPIQGLTGAASAEAQERSVLEQMGGFLGGLGQVAGIGATASLT